MAISATDSLDLHPDFNDYIDCSIFTTVYHKRQ